MSRTHHNNRAHHNNRFSARTRARKRAVDILFEADQKGLIDDRWDLLNLLDERRHLSTAQADLPAYADTIVQGVADHLIDIDDRLIRFSRGWSLDRMPAADRATMRVAVWEIVYNDDVDGPVAINEAMAITREIGTDKSPNFVNGVLSAIYRDAQQEPAGDETDDATTDDAKTAVDLEKEADNADEAPVEDDA